MKILTSIFPYILITGEGKKNHLMNASAGIVPCLFSSVKINVAR
jgi:hypothetical protein